MLNITIIGTGYVGLSNAVLLAQHNQVTALDIDSHKVELINRKKSPISDTEIEDYLADKPLNLQATTDKSQAYKSADFIIVATPTDYNPQTNYFNTSSVESVIKEVVQINAKATIIIKSTIPVGFTERLKAELGVGNIIFSPDFFARGKSLIRQPLSQPYCCRRTFPKGAAICRIIA